MSIVCKDFSVHFFPAGHKYIGIICKQFISQLEIKKLTMSFPVCRIVHDDLSTYKLDLTDDLLKDLGGKDRKDSSSILFSKN